MLWVIDRKLSIDRIKLRDSSLMCAISNRRQKSWRVEAFFCSDGDSEQVLPGPLVVIKQPEDVLCIMKKLRKRRIRTPGPRGLVWWEILCSHEYEATDMGLHKWKEALELCSLARKSHLPLSFLRVSINSIMLLQLCCLSHSPESQHNKPSERTLQLVMMNWPTSKPQHFPFSAALVKQETLFFDCCLHQSV